MRSVIAVLAAVDVISAIYLVNWGPFPLVVKELGAPTAYLNIYVHVPAGIVMYIMATAALASALWGVKRPSPRVIQLMDVSAYITAALAWYAFVSGTLWAAESWGTPLALDPRQMSILAVALVFSLYPAIRRGVEDPDRSVKLAQSYLIAGYVLVVISLVAPVVAKSLHPQPGATLTGTLRLYMMARTILVAAFFFTLLLAAGGRKVVWIYMTGAVVALAMLYPWLLGPVRVVDVTATSIVLEDGRALPISPSQVLTPAEVEGYPTLPKNFVLVRDGEVELVRHYSAYINAALYFLTAAAVLRAVGKR
ncbi:MAG: cytochrome c biogenesis protein CcsA [Pyrobaculum sp.]